MVLSLISRELAVAGSDPYPETSTALAPIHTLGNARPDIAESWQRSFAAGVDPGLLDVPFEPVVENTSPMLEAATPVLDQLLIDIGESPVVFVLANQRGQILSRRVAAPGLATHLGDLLFAEGSFHGEESVGTNGIGTALASGRGTLVNGPEHFADALTALVTAGAPIIDPISRQTIGVVGVVSWAAHGSALMLACARRAAREIEQCLVDTTGIADRMALHQFLQERKRAKGPMVFMTEHRMIANAAADRLLADGDEAILREAAHQLLAETTTGPATVVLTNGANVVVRVERVADGNASQGAVLHLRERADSAPGETGKRNRAISGWSSLTATEQSVTDLVAQGLTNQEAGERLFLSRHTIGFHLRAVFRKLQVSSRVELTRLVMQHEATPDRAPALAAER